MTHPASPRQCPTCRDYLVLAEPVWEDGKVTGSVDVCRSCGPIESAVDDDKAARKTSTAKK